MQDEQNNINVRKITLMSLIPGLGQFANGQAFKGIVFLGIFVAFILQLIVGGFHSLIGLVTLGTLLIYFDSRNAATNHYGYFFYFLWTESVRCQTCRSFTQRR